MADTLYYYAVGRRKTAIARVRLVPGGNGAVIVNGKEIAVYLQRSTHQAQAVLPLRVTDNLGKFNISAKVVGGGITGWAGAISLGVARALVKMDETLKPQLRRFGLLTRDPRVKERKKYGLKR